jgi:hypothetical protein
MGSFIRSYVVPFFVILTFLIALVAVSARIFLPSDMAAPAPVEESQTATSPEAGTPEAIPDVEAPTLPTSGEVIPQGTGS